MNFFQKTRSFLIGVIFILATALFFGGLFGGAVEKVKAAISWTDPIITSNTTKVRQIHFSELKTQIDATRTAAGLGVFSYSWSISQIAVGLPIRAAHINELRNAIKEVWTKAGQSLIFTDDPAVANVTLIRAVHIDELRKAVENAPIIAAATCSDGIQNQGETGIDCGGPCTACAPTYTYSWQIGGWGACSSCCDNVPGTQARSVWCKRNDGAYVAYSFCPAPAPAASQSCSNPQACQHILFKENCQAAPGPATLLYISGAHTAYGVPGQCIQAGDPSHPFTNQCWVYGTWSDGKVTNKTATCSVVPGAQNVEKGSAFYSGWLAGFRVSGTSPNSGSCNAAIDPSGNCSASIGKCLFPSMTIIP